MKKQKGKTKLDLCIDGIMSPCTLGIKEEFFNKGGQREGEYIQDYGK